MILLDLNNVPIAEKPAMLTTLKHQRVYYVGQLILAAKAQANAWTIMSGEIEVITIRSTDRGEVTIEGGGQSPDDDSILDIPESIDDTEAFNLGSYAFNLLLGAKASNTQITRLAFRNRFTLAEKRVIYTLAKTNVDIQIFLDDLSATRDDTGVDLVNTETMASINFLASAGIITPARASEILNTPTQPHEVI